MGIFNFFVFAASRGLFSEFTQYDYEDSFPFSLAPDVIREGKSKYAYISTFSGDDAAFRQMTKAIILGYNLKNLSSKIDRILLVPDDISINGPVLRLLDAYWTHVYRVARPNFPCEKKFSLPYHKHFWFKLNAWKIDKYKKLLYVGRDSLFIKDPSPIFEYPAPASTLDFQLWNVSEYGPVHNTDFFLFSPSFGDFEALLHNACDWIDKPEVGGSRAKRKDAVNIGAFDNGLLEEFYSGNITTLPFWWQFELPEANDLERNDFSQLYNRRIVSYKFSRKFQPWTMKNSPVSQAWTVYFGDAFSSLEMKLDRRSLGIQDLHDTSSFNYLMELSSIEENFSDSEIFSTFGELLPSSGSSIMTECITIILISLGSLGFALSFVGWSSGDQDAYTVLDSGTE